MDYGNKPLVQLEVPDYDLGLRGKIISGDKLGPGKNAALCTILYGLSVNDDVTDTYLSSASNGYPDATAVPDEDSRIELPWRKATQAVIADMVDSHGEAVPQAPRSLLKSLMREYKSIEIEPVLGYEYEVYLSQLDDAQSNPHAIGRTLNAYSLHRIADVSSLIEEFYARMDASQAPLEAFHSELGPGFFEFTMGPQTAVKAADGAARAKQYLRELCAENGLRATFMAKLHIDHSGSGGHVHQSLLRGSENVFAEAPGKLSEIGASYIAGLLASMGDASALFNPLINSYKRLSAEFFVSPFADWGIDDRNASCRAILGADTSAARVESRRPGADANPYLVAAGLLAGGLHGIREQLTLPPPVEDGEPPEETTEQLPSTLTEATARFKRSKVLRELLGDGFVDSFAASRQGELNAFDSWWRDTITDWEIHRYLEYI